MRKVTYNQAQHVPREQAFDIFQQLCFNGKIVDAFLDKDESGTDIFCMVAERIDKTGNMRFNLEIPDGFDIEELKQIEEDFK